MKSATSELAAVIGHPVAHSLSPAIFAFLGKTLGRELGYGRIDVDPRRLRGLYRVSRDLGFFRGWNVTLPHKVKIALLVDELSAEAKIIGAVNVVAFERGRARGHNTDWLGVKETLREGGLRLRGKATVIYGAGGAARAVAFGLGKAGASPIYVVNRSPARGKQFCRSFSKVFPRSVFLPCQDIASIPEEVHALINATPLGMQGTSGRFLLPSRLSRSALAFDLIYRPSMPSFLLAAKARGLRTVNGLDMLIWQAIATWEIWFGRITEQKRKPLKEALKRRLIPML